MRHAGTSSKNIPKMCRVVSRFLCHSDERTNHAHRIPLRLRAGVQLQLPDPNKVETRDAKAGYVLNVVNAL